MIFLDYYLNDGARKVDDVVMWFNAFSEYVAKIERTEIDRITIHN